VSSDTLQPRGAVSKLLLKKKDKFTACFLLSPKLSVMQIARE